MFRRILIANRGEIACRIIRTCRRLGIETVAVHSEADRGAAHVRMADQALAIGGAAPADSYLHIERIVQAAEASDAEAIHPGYGFLAENAAFAEACAEAGLRFIGPSPETIRRMGSKSEAKRIMEAADVPTVPGYHGADQSEGTLAAEAERIGYPVMIKPVAGGGGKGMRVVHEAAELADALAGARREAASSFGDDGLLIERFIERPRHVEFQVFGDGRGATVHLFERECSLQRRYQKIVEETPSPALDKALRSRMGEAAVAAARAVDYIGAGTVEFILDPAAGEFFFMEMNTRLQVEHPVTEMVTGLDLVEWQIRVAAGEPLPLSQDAIRSTGHAVEVRIYAEDPARGFLPSVGRLNTVSWPRDREGLRVDSGVAAGDVVSIHYDPMIAKLVAHGADRREALTRLSGALTRTRITGVSTNIPFLESLLSREDILAGDMDTGLVDRELEAVMAEATRTPLEHRVAAALARLERRTGELPADAGPWARHDGWRLGLRRERVRLEGPDGAVSETERLSPGATDHADARLSIDGTEHVVDLVRSDETGLLFRLDGQSLTADVVHDGPWCEVGLAGKRRRFRELPLFDSRAGARDDEHHPGAPMPGRVVKLHVAEGDRVEQGQALLVLEGMKMEFTLTAPMDGVVGTLRVAEGDSVEAEVPLVDIEEDADG